MEKVYLRCFKLYFNGYYSKKTMTVDDITDCFGVAVTEDFEGLGEHTSSSPMWLRIDLKSKFDNSKYEIIDQIDADVERMLISQPKEQS